MEFLGGLFILYLLYWIFGGGKEKYAKGEAEKAYQESLTKLSNDPNNPDLKLSTIVLGRKHSELSRDKNGNTALSEKALMVDINAACQKAVCHNAEPLPVTVPEPSVHTRLKTLLDLKSQGLIEEDEYQAHRTEILKSI